MASFLFHIGCEDIPATYQKDAEEQLHIILKKALEKEFSFLTCSDIKVFVALRHVAFRLEDINIALGVEEKKGPLVSLGKDIFQKFLQTNNLEEKDCYVKSGPRGDLWMGRVSHEKKQLSEILPDFVKHILGGFSWPKMMTWPQSQDPWVRPVRFITALLGKDIVPMSFFGQQTGNLLQGHRLLSSMRANRILPGNHNNDSLGVENSDISEINIPPKNHCGNEYNGGKAKDIFPQHYVDSQNKNSPLPFLDETMGGFFPLDSSDDYEETLMSLGIMPHKKYHGGYMDMILNNLLDPLGLSLHPQHREALREENMGLVSWPVALLGSFEEHFLALPPVVILNTLAHHQRCFCVVRAEDPTETLLNKFVVIGDGLPLGSEDTTPEKGYERVVRARLTDALFFCQEDQKKSLIDYNEALYKRRFFEDLGSFGHKTQRLTQRAPFLGQKYGETHDFSEKYQDILKNLAERCKSSMACSLVEEYPELQGFMGAYYGTQQKLPYAQALETYGTWHNKVLYFQQDQETQKPDFLSPQWLRQWFQEQKDGFSPLDVLPSLGKDEEFSGLLSFLDTTDTLVGFFSLGKVPTGSKDPMALRRSCHGMLKSLLALKESLDLSLVFSWSQETYKAQGFLNEPWPQWLKTLKDFTIERLDYLFPQIYGFSLNTSLKKALLAENSTISLDPLYIAALSFFDIMTSSCEVFRSSYHRVFSLLALHGENSCDTPVKPSYLSQEEKHLECLIGEPWGLWPTFSQISTWGKHLQVFLDNLHVAEEPYKTYRLDLLKRVMKKIPFSYNIGNE